MDTARSEQALLEEKNMDQLIFDFAILESEGYKALQLRKSEAAQQRLRVTKASSASSSSGSSSDQRFSARMSVDESLQIVEEVPQKNIPKTEFKMSLFNITKTKGRIVGPGELLQTDQRFET